MGLYVLVIIVSCGAAFFLNTRNFEEKITAAIYAIAGLVVMFYPMSWGWQLLWGIIVCGGIMATMNDGFLNPKKTPCKLIGIMMFVLVILKIVVIDWMKCDISGMLFFWTAFWCYLYISAIRKK